MPYGRVCSQRGGLICTDCPTGRCRLDNTRRNQKSRNHGLHTPEWRGSTGKRAAALAAAGGRCQLQFPGCTGTATTVHLDADLNGDHLQATLDDLTACCGHCHGILDAPRASKA